MHINIRRLLGKFVSLQQQPESKQWLQVTEDSREKRDIPKDYCIYLFRYYAFLVGHDNPNHVAGSGHSDVCRRSFSPV